MFCDFKVVFNDIVVMWVMLLEGLGFWELGVGIKFKESLFMIFICVVVFYMLVDGDDDEDWLL